MPARRFGFRPKPGQRRTAGCLLVAAAALLGSTMAAQAADIPGGRRTNAVIQLDTQLSGTLERVGDRDWYKVALRAGNTYEFHVFGLDGDTAQLILRDPSGSAIDQSTERLGEVVFKPRINDTYFLDAGDPGNRTQRYSLIVGIGDLGAARTTEGRIASGQSVFSTHEWIGDTDSFRAPVEAGNRYQWAIEEWLGETRTSVAIQVRDLDGGAWPDPEVEDDPFGTVNFRAPRTETILVRVVECSGPEGLCSPRTGRGAYRLSMEEVTP